MLKHACVVAHTERVLSLRTTRLIVLNRLGLRFSSADAGARAVKLSRESQAQTEPHAKEREQRSAGGYGLNLDKQKRRNEGEKEDRPASGAGSSASSTEGPSTTQILYSRTHILKPPSNARSSSNAKTESNKPRFTPNAVNARVAQTLSLSEHETLNEMFKEVEEEMERKRVDKPQSGARRDEDGREWGRKVNGGRGNMNGQKKVDRPSSSWSVGRDDVQKANRPGTNEGRADRKEEFNRTPAFDRVFDSRPRDARKEEGYKASTARRPNTETRRPQPYDKSGSNTSRPRQVQPDRQRDRQNQRQHQRTPRNPNLLAAPRPHTRYSTARINPTDPRNLSPLEAEARLGILFGFELYKPTVASGMKRGGKGKSTERWRRRLEEEKREREWGVVLPLKINKMMSSENEKGVDLSKENGKDSFKQVWGDLV